VEDAVKDAQGEDDLLESYGGTELPEPASRGPAGAAPGHAHPRAASPSAVRSTAQLHATAGAGVSNGHGSRPHTAGTETGGARSSRHQ
jgi:hypothetical protein